MKFSITAVVVAAAMVMAPLPAFAAFCTNEGPYTPYTFEYREGRTVRVIDYEARADRDRQRLREIGIAAIDVERWNGCLRAFVRQPDGGQSMELYDPATLRRLQ